MLGGWDAFAVVLDPEEEGGGILDLRFLIFEAYQDRVAFGGVFEGVVNQVDQGLLEGFAVGGDLIIRQLRVEG